MSSEDTRHHNKRDRLLLTVKRDDDYPTIEAALTDADGEVIDLSDPGISAIEVHADHLKTGTPVINATATVVDAPAGKVEYPLSATETAREGLHNLEFVIQYTDGRTRTVPQSGYYYLEVDRPVSRGQLDPGAVDGSTSLSVGYLSADEATIGTLSVTNAPIDADDAVRKAELDTKADQTTVDSLSTTVGTKADKNGLGTATLSNYASVSTAESRTTARTVTVNVPSDFPTVNAALNEIRQVRPAPGLRFTVNIETGHKLQEKIHIENEDLGHVTITSTDLTVGLADTFPAATRLFTIRNAVSPTLKVVFDGLVGGTNHDAEAIMPDRNSSLRIEGGGAINCWRGMEPHRNAFVYAEGARFNGNTERGISITRNALVCLESTCEATGNGTYNIRIGGTGVLHANPGVVLTGGGQGLHVTGYGRAVAPSADVSNCGTGVDARGGFLQIGGLVANNCTNDAIRLDGSIVDINSATIGSPGAIGIHIVNQGGVIGANGVTISNAVGTGIRAAAPATIDLATASITGAGGQGVMARFGAQVSANGATVTGSFNHDINIGSGSIVAAENCKTSTSVGSVPHTSDVNVSFNSVSGKGIVFAEAFETV